MVRQYPYTCNWIESIDGGVDGNGFPLPSTGESKSVNCRYEAFQKGQFKQVTNEDGEVVEATGVLYFKRGSEYPARFKVVDILEYGVKLDVIHSYKGQLNTTVYTVEV